MTVSVVRAAAPRWNPETWPTRAFGSLVDEFRYGTSNKSADTGLPALRIPNVVGGGLDLDELKCVPVSAANEARLRLREGDLLFVRTNGNPDYVGRCAAFSEEAVSASGFPADHFIYASYLIRARLRPDEVEPAFIREFMRSSVGRAQLRARSKTSAGQYNINIEGLSGIQVPLPPVDVQRDIVGVLQQAEAVRRSRLKSIALLDHLSQSAFFDMFGDPVRNDREWVRVELGSLLDRIDSGRSPVCLDRPAEAGEWAILKLGAVTTCEYIPGENKALPSLDAVDPVNEVKAGDILFSRKNTRELVGASVLVTETPQHLLMPDLIFRLVVKPDALLDKWYLHRLLTYPTKRVKVRELANGSAGSMPNISKSRLMTFQVELPPLDLQRKFSGWVKAITELKSQHRTHLAELDALFASLQYSTFHGEP